MPLFPNRNKNALNDSTAPEDASWLSLSSFADHDRSTSLERFEHLEASERLAIMDGSDIKRKRKKSSRALDLFTKDAKDVFKIEQIENKLKFEGKGVFSIAADPSISDFDKDLEGIVFDLTGDQVAASYGIKVNQAALKVAPSCFHPKYGEFVIGLPKGSHRITLFGRKDSSSDDRFVLSRRYFSRQRNQVELSSSPEETQESFSGENFVPFSRIDVNYKSIEEYLIEKNKEFNSYLDVNPHDVQAWIDFAQFQFSSHGLHGQSSSDKFLSERVCSILGKSLKSNPDNDVLLYLFLSMKVQTLTPQQSIRLWNMIFNASVSVSSSLLWRKYLQFRQSQFISFSTRSLRHVHEETIMRLRISVQEQSSEENLLSLVPSLNSSLIEILIKSSQADKAAGFFEIATSRLVAFVEFNMFKPESLLESDRLGEFKHYWHSKFCKLGEAPESCWSNRFQLATRRSAEINSFSVPYHSIQQWIDGEMKASKLCLDSFVPSCGFFSNNFSCATFAEIESFLVQVQDPGLIIHVLFALLEMMSFPEEFIQYIHGTLLENTLLGCQDLECFQSGKKNLDVCCLERLQQRFHAERKIHPERQEFISNTLMTISKFWEFHPSVAAAVMFWFFYIDPKKGAKISKGILKQRPDNRTLFVYFGILNRLTGQTELSHKVFGNLISSCKEDMVGYFDTPFIVWISLYLEGFTLSKLLHTLSAFSIDSPEQLRLIVTRHSEESGFWKQSRSGDLYQIDSPPPVVCIFLLYSEFQLALASSSPSSIDFPEFFSSELSSKVDRLEEGIQGRQHLWLLKAYVTLLKKLVILRPRQASILRGALEQALKEFPADDFFLANYLQIFGRHDITLKCRRFLRSISDPRSSSLALLHPNPKVWIHSVLHELERSSTYNQIQRLLERSLFQSKKGPFQSGNCASCAALWRLYLKLESQFGSVVKLQRLFFRAIHHCPGSKMLWIEGLQLLKDSLKLTEFIEFLAMMQDKELRVLSRFDISDLSEHVRYSH